MARSAVAYGPSSSLSEEVRRSKEVGLLVESDPPLEEMPAADVKTGRQPTGPASFGARLWSVLLGVWGALVGIAPHVLHHVGPLAGAAFLAGVGGQLLFAGIALVVSIPFLLRIHRRFQSWAAPAIALAVMVVMFSLSTFVIGPAIRGNDVGPNQPTIEQTTGGEHSHEHS